MSFNCHFSPVTTFFLMTLSFMLSSRDRQISIGYLWPRKGWLRKMCQPSSLEAWAEARSRTSSRRWWSHVCPSCKDKSWYVTGVGTYLFSKWFCILPCPWSSQVIFSFLPSFLFGPNTLASVGITLDYSLTDFVMVMAW